MKKLVTRMVRASRIGVPRDGMPSVERIRSSRGTPYLEACTITALILSAALALALAACATEPANTAADGSSAGSARASEATTTSAEATSSEPSYDPIDLCRDNPLGEAEIASVTFRLSGVGEYELTGSDADAMIDILQSDNRVWQDHTSDSSALEWTYYKTTEWPIRLFANLASGQELELEFFEAGGTSTNIVRIDDEEDFDLSADEFEDAVAIRDRAYEALTEELDETVAPFADLSLDGLDHIERIRHYLEEDQSEQVLSDEEAKQVIETLRELELEPATADFEPQTMYGGGYAYFELWFENGEHYPVGAHTSYSVYDGDTGNRLDTYPVAYIDGVVYRCNMDYASDISKDYTATKEEYRDYYFAEGISASEYPFETVTAEDIELATVDLMNDTYQYSPDLVTSGIVPQSTFEAIAEVLRQFRISDDNSVSMFDATEGINTAYITVCFSNGEKDSICIYNGTLRIDYFQYTQDDDVIDAFVDLIAELQDAYYDLIDSVGPTYVATSQIPAYETGNQDIDSRYLTFELPEALAYHDDGYYPDGYTLEDAPISVTFFGYSGWNGNVDSDSNEHRLDRAMETSDGSGIYRTFLVFNHVTGDYYSDWHTEPGKFELLFSNGAMNVIEIDIRGDADYEIAPEAIFARIIATLDDSHNY